MRKRWPNARKVFATCSSECAEVVSGLIERNAVVRPTVAPVRLPQVVNVVPEADRADEVRAAWLCWEGEVAAAGARVRHVTTVDHKAA
jgi:hypothetical protein